MLRLLRPFRLQAARWTRIALAGLGLAACRDAQQQPAAAGPNDIGGTMVAAQPGEPGTLHPGLVGLSIERQITDLLYDRLAEIGDDLNSVGDRGFRKQLADSWEWAPDSLSIAFHLNPRARWHDGRPVTASDVRYSVALLKDPAFGSPNLPLITNVDSVAVRDSLTAVAYFKRRTPEQFFDLVYQVVIVPQHVFQNTPAAQMKTAEVARSGIGSGRFRLARFEPGKQLELIADTANYRGRPKLDRIVYVPAPDFNAAVTRFFAGDADFFEQLRPEHIARIANDTTRRTIAYSTLGYAYLALNNIDPAQPGMPHPIFGDRAVRRALTMAVDRRAMLRNVFGSYGTPSYGPFASTLPVADTTLPQLPYDTARARALLDSAGWLPGPDGVRVKNGRRLEFGMTTPVSSAARKQYSVLLQDAFKRIGAVARIEEVDLAGLAAKNGDRSFDTILELYSADPSVTGFKQSWTTSGLGKDGSNFPSYGNPVVDALIDSATTTFEPARTRAFARRAFETIIEDAPGIWLYEQPAVAGIHKRIRTTAMRADGYWSGMADWWIPAAERTARDRIGLRQTP